MLKSVLIAVSVGALLMGSPPSAEPSELRGSSRSYLYSRESFDSENHLTVYEYVDSVLGPFSDDRLSLHLGFWGRVDLQEESYGKTTNGEFQYGFLQFKGQKYETTAQLGRFYVSEGVAISEQMDGLYLRGGLKGGFAVTGYGGVPLETESDGRNEDLIYGGRISQGIPGLYEVGVSYLKAENDGADFREETGIDLYLRPRPFFELVGSSSYNNLESELRDHDYRLYLSPGSGLSLNLQGSFVDYQGYFDEPSFSVFLPPFIDSEERLLTVGGEVEYTLIPGLWASLGYWHYDYDIADTARALGGRLRWTPTSADLGISYRRMEGGSDPLSYHEIRGYAYKDFGRWDLTLDVMDLIYDQEINGVDYAFTLAFTAGYSLGERLRLAADLEYSRNPFFENDLQAFVKFIYRFSAPVSGGGGS